MANALGLGRGLRTCGFRSDGAGMSVLACVHVCVHAYAGLPQFAFHPADPDDL